MKKKYRDDELSFQQMDELSIPIEKAILLCDDEYDLLKLACVMARHAREIFDAHLGVDGRKQMFKDFV
jgi:hypothetical protein